MENKRIFSPNPKLKLMAQVKEVLRYHHYAYRTEQTYCDWILRFIRFYGLKKHPKDMAEEEVERFLSWLATDQKVVVSTQKQALNAIVFLYRHVLDKPLINMTPIQAKRKVNIPTVLTQNEVSLLLNNISGTHALMAKLMYGTGLRLMECVRLRIKDIDFGQGRIVVHSGKGNKDRTTILPEQLSESMQQHIEGVIYLHNSDLEKGFGEVWMPDGLGRKYLNACKEIGWQYVFPSRKRSIDPLSSKMRRHHVMESGLQKAVKAATRKSRINKRVTTHTLRHSFATHMLENGTNIRVLQKLMGHYDVKTTEIYTHVMQKEIVGLTSPLDLLKSD